MVIDTIRYDGLKYIDAYNADIVNNITVGGTSNLEVVNINDTTTIDVSTGSKEFIVKTGTVDAIQTVAITDSLLLNAVQLGFHGSAAVPQASPIPDPTGGTTVDVEARAAITDLLNHLRSRGDIAP